jgi:hypothetical protein
MPSLRHVARTLLAAGFLPLLAPPASPGQEPPALNPFGPPSERPDRRRDDALPGFVELSDGTVHPGQVHLTRDTRLRIFDEARKQHREVPLSAIRRIDCKVLKEWIEEEWRFKENASDEKVYTGRSYPAREYTHTITLRNGQAIRGALSGVVYVRAPSAEEPRRFLLHKRDKGPPGTGPKDLVYVRSIQLGEGALAEALRLQGAKARRN